MTDSLRHHGLQHPRLPCLSLTPGACSNSCPWNWWCRPAISSSVIPFFSCLQSFPASGPFPLSQFFASGGQSIRVSVSASPKEYNGAVSVQFSCSVVSSSLRPHRLLHTRLPCPSPTPGAYSNLCPLSGWCHPLSSPFPAFNLSQHHSLFQWVSSLHQVAKVLEFQPQHPSFQWIFRTDFL